MSIATIELSYKQVIDPTQKGWFEKEIIKSSYSEFLLKSQAYNPDNKFKTFQEMVTNDGKANSLHYKCGAIAIPLVNLLKNNIPYLTDNIGRNIKFEKYVFEIIDSDISNPAAHKVSITYSTGRLVLVEKFGDCMLLSSGEQVKGLLTDTFLLKIVPGLSIDSFLRTT